MAGFFLLYVLPQRTHPPKKNRRTGRTSNETIGFYIIAVKNVKDFDPNE